MKRALPVLAAALVLVGYLASYLVARSRHLIVHVRPTAQDAHGHFVVADQAVEPALGAPGIVAVLTPLRVLETGCWLVLEPRGSKLGLP